MRGDPPIIRNVASREGAVVIRHREYIQDIVSSATASSFKVDTFPLNPGMAAAFPWLNSIASSFEEYILNGMLFEFKSITSDAISSASLATIGEVILATQYDALNAPFTSNVQMLNYEYAQVAKASQDCIHMIECDPRQSAVSSHLYVRSTPPPGNSDIRLYDHGTFSIASNQIAGTSVVLGQLWCTYEVLLFKPKIPTALQLTTSMFKWLGPSLTQNQPITGTGTLLLYPQNTIPVVLGQNNITLPATPTLLSYLVQLNFSAYTAMVCAFNTFTFTNCVRVKAWAGNASAVDASPQTGLAGTTNSSVSFIISTNSPGLAPFISVGNNVAYAGAGFVEGLITEIAYFDPAIYGTA
jgi:hypothetical protein